MELKKGTLLQGGNYKIEKTLGQGSFGITYLATAKFSTEGNLSRMDVLAKVAIKEFFMSDINGRKEDGSSVEGSTGSIFTNYRKRFRKEAENLAKLEHPNIVKIFDVFDENNTTYYVMEYLSDTNLNKYIKNKNGLSEKDCIALTEEIGGALQYMHDSLMLHLDLKPGNIMLRNNEAVLIDFGLSKQFNANGQPESGTTIGKGTPGYAPLEQQNYNGSQVKELPYTMDIYALGGTMFKMITGLTPPDASSIFNEGFPRYELEKHNVSKHLVNVIEKGMSPRKKDRYQTVSALLYAINPYANRSKSKFKTSKDTDCSVSETIISKTDSRKDLIKENAETKSKSDYFGIKTESVESGPGAALKVGSEITSPNGKVYVIERLLGMGSFNFTYLCHDYDYPKSKVILREFFLSDYNSRQDLFISSVGDSNLVDYYKNCFKRQAQTLRALYGHPNIENYLDSFDANGTHFIASKYVKGESLYDLLNKQHHKFTEKEVIGIAKQICVALEHMKKFGYMHLDIKPSNIIQTSDRKSVLIGFGLAKKQSCKESSDGVVGFTSGYSSMEQELGTGRLTPAADIYSLGATMYTLLTGKKPLRPSDILENGFSRMENVLKDNHISFEMIKVIKTAMSVSINNRYQSAEAMSKALNDIKPSNYTNEPRNKKQEPLPKHDQSSQQDDPNKKMPGEVIVSYDWMPALCALAIGSIFILCMKYFVHEQSFNFGDLDSDGRLLMIIFSILVFLVVPFVIWGRMGIPHPRKWNKFRNATVGLFILNTFLLGIWNYSLTMAFVILSVGLLFDSFLLILLKHE